MSRFVAGVDGGGTHARAVILDQDGLEVARSVGRGAVVTGRDVSTAADAVVSVVRAAAKKGAVDLPLTALWAGLAGAGREPARSAIEEHLRVAHLANNVTVGTDLDAALHNALHDAAGIMLLAGTGSVAVGRATDGAEVRVGGWGRWLGDEGSGFWIGLEAARRVAHTVDGRGDTTALRDLIVKELALGDPVDLIDWMEKASKADVAGLAPMVFRAADAGDAVAATIVADAAAALARHVAVIHERAGPWPNNPRLVLCGGLVAPGGPLRERVLESLRPLALDVDPRDVDPALGAAERALEILREVRTG